MKIKSNNLYIAFICIALFLGSCGGDTLPKPKSYLTLNYPEASYINLTADCPYSFEISKSATFILKDNCWGTIEYPTLKAKLHLTYRKVDDNLKEILMELDKLTFEHTVKADNISPKDFENLEKRVFGTLYNVEGNVATNIQFKVTDSLNHVLAGALYFYTKPNYDSIVPAVKYIEKDIEHLVETLTWK